MRHAFCQTQGKKVHLGTFTDPISAAKRYDREAEKVHGANALLNFPPGCNTSLTTTGAAGQASVQPGSGERANEGPETNKPLTAGNPGENLPPLHAVQVPFLPVNCTC
jgi:hypothetical protein